MSAEGAAESTEYDTLLQDAVNSCPILFTFSFYNSVKTTETATKTEALKKT